MENLTKLSPLESLRAEVRALSRSDLRKLARFAGLSAQGIEFFASGRTVSPSMTTFAAMQSGLERLRAYKRERDKFMQKFPELADGEDSKPADLG